MQAQNLCQACTRLQTHTRPSLSQACSRGHLLQGKNVTRESLASDSRMERVTAAILSGAPQYSAADAFDAFTVLNELRAAARVEMARVDFLVVPSAAHHYTIAGESLPYIVSTDFSLPVSGEQCRCRLFRQRNTLAQHQSTKNGISMQNLELCPQHLVFLQQALKEVMWLCRDRS